MPLEFKRRQEWTSSDILFAIARLPQTQRLIVGSSDFQIYELDVSVEKPERVAFTGETHESYVTGLVLAGQTLISGSYDGTLTWWDIESRSTVRRQPAHERWIRRVTISPDGTRAVSIADDMQCKVWDVASGELVATLEGHAVQTPHHYPSMLYAVAVSEDGKFLSTADRIGVVKIWDAQSFEQLGEVQAPGMYTWDPKRRRHSIGGVRSLAFSPDSSKLAVGGIGQIDNIDHLGGPSRLELFDWQSESAPQLIEDDGKKGLIEQILWQPDGARLIGLGGDHKGFVNLYDLASGEIVAQGAGSGHIHGAVVDETGKTFYTAAHNRIEQWELVDSGPDEQ